MINVLSTINDSDWLALISAISLLIVLFTTWYTSRDEWPW